MGSCQWSLYNYTPAGSSVQSESMYRWWWSFSLGGEDTLSAESSWKQGLWCVCNCLHLLCCKRGWPEQLHIWPSSNVPPFSNLLAERKLAPFSRLYDLPWHSRKESADRKIRLFCKCFMPETWDNMIMCDNCEEWFHYKCINQLSSKEQEWFCYVCVH